MITAQGCAETQTLTLTQSAESLQLVSKDTIRLVDSRGREWIATIGTVEGNILEVKNYRRLRWYHRFGWWLRNWWSSRTRAPIIERCGEE